MNNLIWKADQIYRHFSKEDIKVANKHKKRCSISFATREWLTSKTKNKTHTHKQEFQVLVRMESGKNSDLLLIGIQNGTATVEKSSAVSCQVNRSNIC